MLCDEVGEVGGICSFVPPSVLSPIPLFYPPYHCFIPYRSSPIFSSCSCFDLDFTKCPRFHFLITSAFVTLKEIKATKQLQGKTVVC